MKTLTASDRQSLLRLAATLPKGSEERRTLLKGVKEARVIEASRWPTVRDVSDLTPEKAEGVLRDLSMVIATTARDSIRSLRDQAHESERRADDIEKAWDKWDWDALARLGIIDRKHADLAEEILATYEPDPDPSSHRWAFQAKTRAG